MKVGYVLEQFPKLSETFILEEMLELERLGLELTVFALSDSKEDRVHEKVGLLKADASRSVAAPLCGASLFGRHKMLRLHQIRSVGPKKWFWGMRMSSWLASEAQKRSINHLHAHFAGDAAWVAMLASKISKIPYSFTAHAGGLFGWPYLLEEKVEGAKFVVAISEFNKKHLGGYDKIKVIHCGLDLVQFSAGSEPRSDGALRARLFSSAPRILTVARLEEKKGHRYLFDALKIIKDKGIDFNLTLVGGGVLENSLKEQICALGLEDRVAFTGPITQKRVRKLLGGADLFVLPCVKAKNGNMDGIPVVLMEAMAVGVPVISTKISGIPELIEDAQSGLLVEPRDTEGLAVAIEKVLASGDLRRQFVQQARVKVERGFDVRKNAEKIRRLLLR